MSVYVFDDPKEQELFDSIYDGLRGKGWWQTDAEDEAWARITRKRFAAHSKEAFGDGK